MNFVLFVLCLLTARKAKLIEVPILKTESPILPHNFPGRIVVFSVQVYTSGRAFYVRTRPSSSRSQKTLLQAYAQPPYGTRGRGTRPL